MIAAGTLLLLPACSSGTPGNGSTSSAGSADTTATTGTTSASATRSDTTSATTSDGTTQSTPSSTTGTTTADPSRTCADTIVARLTPEQRVGQLLMVGIQPDQAPGGLDGTIAEQHIGGAIFLGGWSGAGTVRTTASHIQSRSTPEATGGVRMLVAADQEGGQVQQLKGAGFSTLPSALEQGQQSTGAITANAKRNGAELAAAGVNVNLAPVADTVPTAIGRANAPIGRYDREYGHDSATVARAVTAVVQGLRSANMAATVKHFPGLGRITGNTDTTAQGITDGSATTTDAYLKPFAAGIRAGASFVMISSARYPKIDPGNQAVFSPAIISGLLRTTMGYHGVVITDDVGVSKAVAAVAPGERATRFIAAGGDIVLTASQSATPAMASAVLALSGKDPGFAAKVQASVKRVIGLKVTMGLAGCG